MNAVIDALERTQPEQAADSVFSVRKQMFHAFCLALEEQRIPYVILAGYRGYPEHIDSDVDFMVSDADFLRLPDILNNPAKLAGARLVQLLKHETSACYYVLAAQVGEFIAYLHPDAAAAYRRNGRLWLRSESVLATRRQAPAGFWIPAAAVEFEYYFVKRVDKALVEPRHLEALAELLAEDTPGCQKKLTSLLPGKLAGQVEQAIQAKDIAWFAEHRKDLRETLRKAEIREGLLARLASWVGEQKRKLRRVLNPTGMVLAVLGPDGSGKTTVIEHLEREFLPAFRRVRRFHLRPHFGKGSSGTAVTDPHAQPPRGILASSMKVGMFIADYWLGWVKHVVPAKIRSSFIVFDRYYHDMLVDTRRYRLPEKFPLARWFKGLVPQPDLWIVLDARPELLVARKGEISLADAERLTVAYRNLCADLPNALLVDTSQPLDKTLADAVCAVRTYLEARTQTTMKNSA